MLDFMTCVFLSIATVTSLVLIVIGSTNRIRKLKKTQIILPKTESLQNCQPFRYERAFISFGMMTKLYFFFKKNFCKEFGYVHVKILKKIHKKNIEEIIKKKIQIFEYFFQYWKKFWIFFYCFFQYERSYSVLDFFRLKTNAYILKLKRFSPLNLLFLFQGPPRISNETN